MSVCGCRRYLIVAVIIFSILVSSCASTKDFKRNTLIALGVVIGVAVGAKLEENNEENNDCTPESTCNEGGAGLLILFGGFLGGLFGYGVDIQTTTNDDSKTD